MDNTQTDLIQRIAKICLECNLPECNSGKCVRYRRMSAAIINGEAYEEPAAKVPTAELYSHAGKSMTLWEWAAYSGIPYSTLKTRLHRHGDFERAITENVRRSQHRYVEWEGKKVRLTTLCVRMGVSASAVRERLKSGMPLHEALSLPVRKRRQVEWNGETVKITDLCAEYGISYDTVMSRLRRGWTLENAVTTPKKGSEEGENNNAT